MVVIRKCTVGDLIAEPNFQVLLDEYANEIALANFPRPSAKIEMYQQLETLGKIHPIAAYFNGILIGIINVLMSENPHYGIEMAMSESFFVSKDYRKTGAGLKLLHAAEDCARSLGSPSFFVSAPVNGTLIELLPHVNYEETGRTFFKRLGNE